LIIQKETLNSNQKTSSLPPGCEKQLMVKNGNSKQTNFQISHHAL
jgi:competence CoiA-like predicted nuclease